MQSSTPRPAPEQALMSPSVSLPTLTKPRNWCVRLIDALMLAPSVRLLRFKVLDDEPFVYLAGQWIELFIRHNGEEIKRPYSIASAPSKASPFDFEIAVTRVDEGPASSALHALTVGAELRISGPMGFFTREPRPPGPVFFIGTGTGVAPLRAMIQHDLNSDSKMPVALVFGCRTESDILWQSEFEALAHQHARFQYAVTISRPGSTWTGRRGYVQSHLVEIARAVPGSDQGHYYICGLNRMVQDVRNVLKTELGLVRQHIHTERFD